MFPEVKITIIKSQTICDVYGTGHFSLSVLDAAHQELGHLDGLYLRATLSEERREALLPCALHELFEDRFVRLLRVAHAPQ